LAGVDEEHDQKPRRHQDLRKEGLLNRDLDATDVIIACGLGLADLPFQEQRYGDCEAGLGDE
jgi:hypothetical protein